MHLILSINRPAESLIFHSGLQNHSRGTAQRWLYECASTMCRSLRGRGVVETLSGVAIVAEHSPHRTLWASRPGRLIHAWPFLQYCNNGASMQLSPASQSRACGKEGQVRIVLYVIRSIAKAPLNFCCAQLGCSFWT